jgi:cytochrome P450
LFDRPGDDQNAERLFNAIDAITRGLVPQLVTEIWGKGKLKRLFVFQNRRYKQATQEFMTFVYQEIDRKNGQIGQDLISRLMKAQDKKTGYTMTKELLKDEAVNLFFASQDTTVNTLVWFFYLIGKHQTVHKKITEEIRNHKDDLLTQENLGKLSYTKAALYETLRLYPPSTALIRQPLEDVVIGGQAISKGTTIILGMYATHRDEKLWERPNEFYPERFVNPEMETERHKYAFFPFGGGLHNCISATICSNACSFSSIRVSMSLKTSRIMSISAAPENVTRLPRTPWLTSFNRLPPEVANNSSWLL